MKQKEGCAKVQIYLRGPGGQLRRVVEMSPDLATHIRRLSARPALSTERILGTTIDADGRVAVQADADGFMYRYKDEDDLWDIAIQ